MNCNTEGVRGQPLLGYDSPMEPDISGWTGEGTLTPVLIEALKGLEAVAWFKVEDTPASRAEPGYAFISNEVFVRFATERRIVRERRFGIPRSRTVDVSRMTLEGLGEALGGVEGIGVPDYSDAGMLQYLRAERIIPPYQTTGPKVVEMVRIYQLDSNAGPQIGRQGF